MNLKELLEELLQTQDVVITVSREGIVSELTLKNPKVSFSQDSLTCECGEWHIHMKWAEVKDIRFMAEPSHCLKGEMSYSIRFLDKDHQSLMNAYFTKQPKQYEYFKKKYET